MPNVSDFRAVCSSTEHTFDIYAQAVVRLGNGLYATASFFEGGPGVPHRLTLRIMQNVTNGAVDKHVLFEQFRSA